MICRGICAFKHYWISFEVVRFDVYAVVLSGVHGVRICETFGWRSSLSYDLDCYKLDTVWEEIQALSWLVRILIWSLLEMFYVSIKVCIWTNIWISGFTWVLTKAFTSSLFLHVRLLLVWSCWNHTWIILLDQHFFFQAKAWHSWDIFGSLWLLQVQVCLMRVLLLGGRIHNEIDGNCSISSEIDGKRSKAVRLYGYI